MVGHTPTGGVVWPRFNGRVVVNDTGIAAHYGSNDGYLELSGDSAWAGYGDRKLELPVADEDRIAYLREVAGFKPDNKALQDRLREMLAPAVEPAEAPVELAPGETVPDQAVVIPGICQ